MRVKNDQYYSPMKSVLSLKENLHCLPEVVLEPFVGRGDLVKGCQQFISKDINFITNDLYPNPEYEPMTQNDATKSNYWTNAPKVDAVITNPPFSLANASVKAMLESGCASKFYAVMLRLSFLEGTKERGPWMAQNPPDQLIVLPRISFTGKGTDSVTSAWFVWYANKIRINNPIVIIDKTAK